MRSFWSHRRQRIGQQNNYTNFSLENSQQHQILEIIHSVGTLVYHIQFLNTNVLAFSAKINDTN